MNNPNITCEFCQNVFTKTYSIDNLKMRPIYEIDVNGSQIVDGEEPDYYLHICGKCGLVYKESAGDPVEIEES